MRPVEEAQPALRVLIVEDQMLLAMTLETLLTDDGCEVVGVAMERSGALSLAASGRPELALVDINLLDGMTGPTLTRELKAKFGCAVVIITANPEQAPDDFAGALGVLPKPFDDQTFGEVIAFARDTVRGRTPHQAPRRLRLAPSAG